MAYGSIQSYTQEYLNHDQDQSALRLKGVETKSRPCKAKAGRDRVKTKTRTVLVKTTIELTYIHVKSCTATRTQMYGSTQYD